MARSYFRAAAARDGPRRRSGYDVAFVPVAGADLDAQEPADVRRAAEQTAAEGAALARAAGFRPQILALEASPVWKGIVAVADEHDASVISARRASPRRRAGPGNGIGDLRLRALADELGTSHRMLIFHFGSKEHLWSEIVHTQPGELRASLLRPNRRRTRTLDSVSRSPAASCSTFSPPARSTVSMTPCAPSSSSTTRRRRDPVERSRAWVTLHTERGLDPEDARRAVAWALEVLVRELRGIRT